MVAAGSLMVRGRGGLAPDHVGAQERCKGSQRRQWPQELAGIAQLVRARAFQARGRGFESRFPLASESVDPNPSDVNQPRQPSGSSLVPLVPVPR